ncbi:MAG: DUF805 domain-containing protein [Actinomycetia bacterium]|nr:DUF805 domain-containing protein [Actinomycetes bacterium]
MGDIDWTYLLFKFDGRINRAKFWAGSILIWGIYMLWLIAVVAAINVSSTAGALIGFLGIMVWVLAIWSGLAISIKRWHDRGKSGWWVFIGAIPLIGFLWAIIETGFLEGDLGPNEYGPNPLDI